MGWTPSFAAKALSNSKASAIGLVLARPRASVDAERFYFQFIVGVESVLTAHSQSLVLQMVDNISEELDVHQSWWAQRRVDSVILVDPRQEDPRPLRLQHLGMPFVSFGTRLEGGRRRRLRQHLHGRRGRGAPGRPGPPPRRLRQRLRQPAATNRRRRAVVERGEELGVEVLLSNPTDYSEGSGAAETRRLLAGRSRPDAFIFDNEILTLGGLATIAASGLSIPGDVAVVSLEDSPVCRVVTAQISAFLRDPSRLGAAAAQLLVDDLSALETRTIALPSPQLAVRAPSAQSVHVS